MEQEDCKPPHKRIKMFELPQSLGQAARNPLCILLVVFIILTFAFVAAAVGVFGAVSARRVILFFNLHWHGHGLSDSTKILHSRSSHDWSDNVQRGSKLVELMQTKDVPTMVRSAWAAYEEIERYGWTIKDDDVGDEVKKVSQNVLKPITIKQLDNIANFTMVTKKKPWRLVHWFHSESATHMVKNAELESPATRPSYRSSYNCDSGIVVVSNVKSPQHTDIGKGLDHAKLVPLQHWSDIAFLTWKYLCEAQQKPIGDLG